MDIMGFFASQVFGWIFLVLAVAALLGALWALADDHKIASGVIGLFVLLFAFLFIFGNTHTVVPYNYRAVVIDGTTGRINGETRGPGLTSYPFFGSSILLFSSAKSQSICQDFTPSIQGGYEVRTNFCFYVDMSQTDWVSQITKYDKRSYDDLVKVWMAKMAQPVSKAVSGFLIADLTKDKPTVANAVFEGTKELFLSEGMTLNSVIFTTWDFTNKEVGAAYDKTVVSQTAKLQAQAELEANTVRLESMKVMASGQAETLKSLGLTDQDAIVSYLYLQWLQSNPQNPNLSVVVGGTPLIGINKQTAQPTAAPTK